MGSFSIRQQMGCSVSVRVVMWHERVKSKLLFLGPGKNQNIEQWLMFLLNFLMVLVFVTRKGSISWYLCKFDVIRRQFFTLIKIQHFLEVPNTLRLNATKFVICKRIKKSLYPQFMSMLRTSLFTCQPICWELIEWLKFVTR